MLGSLLLLISGLYSRMLEIFVWKFFVWSVVFLSVFKTKSFAGVFICLLVSLIFFSFIYELFTWTVTSCEYSSSVVLGNTGEFPNWLLAALHGSWRIHTLVCASKRCHVVPLAVTLWPWPQINCHSCCRVGWSMIWTPEFYMCIHICYIVTSNQKSCEMCQLYVKCFSKNPKIMFFRIHCIL